MFEPIRQENNLAPSNHPVTIVNISELITLNPYGDETITDYPLQDDQDKALNGCQAGGSDNPFSTASFEGIHNLGEFDPSKRFFETVTVSDIRNANFQQYFEVNRFEDQVVVDLGCAHRIGAFLFANAFGARAYVGVDRFGDLRLLRDKVEDTHRRLQEVSPIKVATCRADMLTFLKAAPDRSLSFISGGIDTMIIPDSDKRLAIAREIERCLDPRGCWLSYNCSFTLDEHTRLRRVDKTGATRFSFTGQFAL